jgi:hypothetical protein
MRELHAEQTQLPDEHVEKEVLGAADTETELGARALQRIHKVSIPEAVIQDAKAELVSKQNTQGAKFTPGRESLPEDYLKTSKLAVWLATTVLEPSGTDLSFIRATGKRKHIYADNLHFDSRYVGYSERRNIRGSFWRPSNSVEIWRQIINLNDRPRHLQIVTTPIKELEKRGIDFYQERPIGREIPGYERPEDVPIHMLTRAIPEDETEVYTIPAYDGVNLPVLELWSSRVLHAGVTAKDGQLMAASAKWVEPSKRDEGGYYAE